MAELKDASPELTENGFTSKERLHIEEQSGLVPTTQAHQLFSVGGFNWFSI